MERFPSVHAPHAGLLNHVVARKSAVPPRTSAVASASPELVKKAATAAQSEFQTSLPSWPPIMGCQFFCVEMHHGLDRKAEAV